MSRDRTQAVRFWANELAGADLQTLPCDGPEPEAASFGAAWSTVDFDRAWRAVQQLTAEHSGSPFAVLVAATTLACMLATGSGDVTIGTTISSRPVEFDTAVGPFVNTVPIRVRVARDASAADLLQASALALARALEYHEVPFDDLARQVVPELPAGESTIPVTLTANTVLDTDLALPGTTCRRIEQDSPYRQRPLAIYLTRGEYGYRLRACASAHRYLPSTVDRLLGSVVRLCEALAADPAARLTDLGWVPREQASADPASKPGLTITIPDPTQAPTGQEIEGYPSLAEIRRSWAEVLELPESELREDFFESGGGSLSAMRLAVRLGLSIKQVFDLRTQAAMAAELNRRN